MPLDIKHGASLCYDNLMRKLLFALASFFALFALFSTNVTPTLAAINDFEIQDYQIDYYLDAPAGPK